MKDSSQIVKELLRVGTVTVKDPENMCCRVTFSDTPTNAVTSYWLPVLVTRAHGDTYYDLPDIGSKVLCAFLPNGHEEGFIEYNRKEHRLFASCVGDVEITAQNNMKINADNVSIKAQGIINLLASQIIAQEG